TGLPFWTACAGIRILPGSFSYPPDKSEYRLPGNRLQKLLYRRIKERPPGKSPDDQRGRPLPRFRIPTDERDHQKIQRPPAFSHRRRRLYSGGGSAPAGSVTDPILFLSHG